MLKKLTNKTLHTSLKVILTIGQCFGLMPVIGISDNHPIKLKFIWKSWRVMFSLVVVLAQGFFASMTVISFFSNGVDLRRSSKYPLLKSTIHNDPTKHSRKQFF